MIKENILSDIFVTCLVVGMCTFIQIYYYLCEHKYLASYFVVGVHACKYVFRSLVMVIYIYYIIGVIKKLFMSYLLYHVNTNLHEFY